MGTAVQPRPLAKRRLITFGDSGLTMLLTFSKQAGGPAAASTREREFSVMPSDTQTGPVVRRATPADLPGIGRLGALLVRTHHDFDPERFIADTPQTKHAYASFLGGQLAEPNVVVLVAERGGEVLGYTYAAVEGYDYMSLRGPAGVLYDIVVDPASRKQGIGRMLLDATLAALEALGAPRVVLSTAERNESAQRLFAHAGFRRTMVEMTREPGDGAPSDGRGEEP
jgi:ribosomal protein S18 acetylase RimI-like enzyme